jgi:hypothetical protein
LLEHNQYDLLVTVSNYFTAHLVGLRLHRKFPDLRWLADIGDPLSFGVVDVNNTALYAGFNRWLERLVFETADVLTLPTPSVLDTYRAMFPAAASKAHLIQQMIYARPPSSQSVLAPPHGVIKLIFAGRLYRALRRPDYLLEVYRRLIALHPEEQFELHVYGYADEVIDTFERFSNLLGSRIFLHGETTHEQVLKAIEGATALVNVGNRSSYAFDSKLVEYAANGKPIINLAPFEHHSSERFLAKYGASITSTECSGAGVSREAQRIYNFLRTRHDVDMRTVNEWLAPYSPESIGLAYDRLIDGMGG